jgi:hypothetical protein
MIVALAANLGLRGQYPYNWLLLGQGIFYGLAALGAIMSLNPKVLRLPFYFCMINSALFAWIYHAVRHGRAVPSRIELDRLGNRPPIG